MEKRSKTGGRQKGAVNKATREFRETVRQLLECNADNVSKWLDRVAVDDPGKALDVVLKLAEFTTPKMTRTELSGVGGSALKVDANLSPADAYRAILGG